MKNIEVRGEQTTITYVYMYTGAKLMLNQATKSNNGSLYFVVSSLVYCAFTLESYFNHLGQLKHSDWNRTERNLPKLKKFIRLADEANIRYDFNIEPYSTLKLIFSFRDSMAHGKTTCDPVSTSLDDFDGLLPNLVGLDSWRAFATIENAQKSIANSEKIINELHLSSGLKGKPFKKFGGAVIGIS